MLYDSLGKGTKTRLNPSSPPLSRLPASLGCPISPPESRRGGPQARDGRSSPLPSGESLLGRSPARRRKPSAPGGNPSRRGMLGFRSEASHWCPVSAARLLLPPGLCEGSCFSLSNLEHRAGTCF